MGASVFVGATGFFSVSHQHGSAALDNGLMLKAPIEVVVGLGPSNFSATYGPFSPGTEIIFRLMPNNVDPDPGAAAGTSPYDNTGAQAQIVNTGPTSLDVTWEDSLTGDFDYNDATTQVTGTGPSGGWEVGKVRID